MLQHIIGWGNMLLLVCGWAKRWWTNLFCDILATLQVMLSIREDLWLHNRHQAILVKYTNLKLVTHRQDFWSQWLSFLWSTTCWQMLAYLARTLAFSAMARADGQPSEILRTHLHLAKSQPSFLYWAQRSESPSRPMEKQATECYGGRARSASFCRNLQRDFPINKASISTLWMAFLSTDKHTTHSHLVWWSPHRFHLDQPCLCPPEERDPDTPINLQGSPWGSLGSSPFMGSSPWCRRQCPYPWWLGGRACRCLTSGRESRGRGWPHPRC